MTIKTILNKLLENSLFLQKLNYWRIYHKYYVRQNPYYNKKPKLENEHGIIYVLAPSYSNLGDVAIFVKSIDYLQKELNLPIKSILYSKQCVCKQNLKSLPVRNDDVIIIQGGGNMGDLYANEEFLRQNVVKWFPLNKIFSMSSSTCFSKKRKNYVLERAKKIYSNHQNLTLVARDKPTQQFYSLNFKCENLLCPDMVLSTKPQRKNEYIKNKTVLLCLRKDIESNISDKIKDEIEKLLLLSGYSFEYWDTDDLSGKNIENKVKKIDEVLNYINGFQFVITDRYHGTILSYISKTPCIGLDNSYGKIKNGFIWFNNCNYMFYADSIYEIKNAIQKIENLSELKINEELYKNFILLEKSLIGEKNE